MFKDNEEQRTLSLQSAKDYLVRNGWDFMVPDITGSEVSLGKPRRGNPTHKVILTIKDSLKVELEVEYFGSDRITRHIQTT